MIIARCIAHARNGHISTSGLKSDVTVVLLGPDFIKNAKISAIRVHLRQIYDYSIFAWAYRTCWPKMRYMGQNKGRGGAILTPNELVLPFGGSYVSGNFGENRSRKCDPKSARRRTDTQTETDYIICPMLYAIAMGQIERTGQDRTEESKKSRSGNISPIWGEAPTVPIRTKICVVSSLPDIITCAKFHIEIFRVTILQGSNFLFSY